MVIVPENVKSIEAPDFRNEKNNNNFLHKYTFQEVEESILLLKVTYKTQIWLNCSLMLQKINKYMPKIYFT